MTPAGARGLVTLGRVAGAYGVRGWLRVFSYTRPRSAILDYGPWYLGRGDDWRPVTRRGGRVHGRGLIAAIEGCTDRDAAEALTGAEIAVPLDRLPDLPEGEFYTHQLVGLEVVNRAGLRLGVVDRLMPTGAHDVLVVAGERERLIPFAAPVLEEVDLEAGRIRVDWEPDY